MKKLYFLLAAAVISMSASAAPIEKIGNKDLSGKFQNKELQSTQRTFKSQLPKQSRQMVVTGMTRVSEGDGLAGDWTFYLGDYYFQDSVGQLDVVVTASYDEEYDEWWFESEDILPFFATFDESTSELSFPAAFLGSMGAYYVSQEPFQYLYEDEGPEGEGLYLMDELIGTFNNIAGTITFFPEEGICWGAYSDLDWNAYEGDFDIFDFEGAEKVDDGAGIGSIAKDKGESVYFNLQGQKVTNPSNGIFIKKQGKTTTKVLVK